MATILSSTLSDADLAALLVHNAGNLALTMRSQDTQALRESATEKNSVSDIVTAADLSAELYVFEQLRRFRPDDSIVGEEGGGYTGTSGRTWVIDPVDGTYNFFSGSTYWCSALALCPATPDDAVSSATSDGTAALWDDEPLIGAIYQPQEDKLWLGGSSQKTTLNGMPVGVDPRAEIGQLSAGTYLHPTWFAGEKAGTPWRNAAQLPATLRMLGSGSCDLARVAQGELGVWFQHSCPAWDWLPGKAIVRAAGGETGVVRVNGLDWFVAGPAEAVAAIMAALAAGTTVDPH
ncbi:inositol monophosphatase family protein [Arthrobacter cryoconiti]|uniref:Inositol monophosphatase family protein n=1 Tax=Arthrobacter cryoconiti TaxID=748907 RepID=A0ABV8R6E5_9MICC|nr:inositol monophosphatase family protein [Arthrobacter cryoconiti]MCC9066841.1 inositol monophosphatase family protein [Arthrobacter cryoconiti]